MSDILNDSNVSGDSLSVSKILIITKHGKYKYYHY